MQWALDRVNEMHPREDGIFRAVTVKTRTRKFQRSGQKLALLRILDNFRIIKKPCI